MGCASILHRSYVGTLFTAEVRNFSAERGKALAKFEEARSPSPSMSSGYSERCTGCTSAYLLYLPTDSDISVSKCAS